MPAGPPGKFRTIHMYTVLLASDILLKCALTAKAYQVGYDTTNYIQLHTLTATPFLFAHNKPEIRFICSQ